MRPELFYDGSGGGAGNGTGGTGNGTGGPGSGTGGPGSGTGGPGSGTGGTGGIGSGGTGTGGGTGGIGGGGEGSGEGTGGIGGGGEAGGTGGEGTGSGGIQGPPGAGDREPPCTVADENEDGECDDGQIQFGNEGWGGDDDEGADEDPEDPPEEEEPPGDDDELVDQCVLNYQDVAEEYGDGTSEAPFEFSQYEVSHSETLTFNPIERFEIPDDEVLSAFPELTYEVVGNSNGVYGKLTANANATFTYEPHKDLLTRQGPNKLVPQSHNGKSSGLSAKTHSLSGL